MVYEVVISLVDGQTSIFGQAIAEFSQLPSPEQIEAVCALVMSDAKFAIATVHVAGFPSILYGMIVESADNGKKE